MHPMRRSAVSALAKAAPKDLASTPYSVRIRVVCQTLKRTCCEPCNLLANCTLQFWGHKKKVKMNVVVNLICIVILGSPFVEEQLEIAATHCEKWNTNLNNSFRKPTLLRCDFVYLSKLRLVPTYALTHGRPWISELMEKTDPSAQPTLYPT